MLCKLPIACITPEACAMGDRCLAPRSNREANPLQFTRNGVPEPDQEAARKEFIERYSVPLGDKTASRARYMREVLRIVAASEPHRATAIRLRNLAATASDETLASISRYVRDF